MVTYLRAAVLERDGASVTELEALFEKEETDRLEAHFHPNNPPMWLFPSSLFLMEAAARQEATAAAARHKRAFLHTYPKSALADRSAS
mmetsp:Transcript_14602/g.34815  ORF Transcript_14602/g.34815 Transcript_14602/m.34815 type:complete len:88 (-) Transcript_14602:278-541(-)